MCVCVERGGGVVLLFVWHGMYINHFFFFFFTADFRAFFCFFLLFTASIQSLKPGPTYSLEYEYLSSTLIAFHPLRGYSGS